MPGIGTLDTSFDHLSIVANIERKVGHRMKHSEVSDYLAGQALSWMREHPERVLGLMWKKTLLYWGPTEPADNKVIAGDRAASSVLRRIPLTFFVVFGLFLAGALLLLGQHRGRVPTAKNSAARAREQWETSVLILYLILVWYASHLPFAVTARYRVPTIPLLFLFGAYFLESEWRMLREKDWRKSEPSMARWHYQRGIAHTRAGQIENSISEYRDALALNPGYSAVHNDLAAVLASRGRIAESIPHFRKALEARPNDASSHFNLALALELVGAIEESRLHYRRAVELRPGDREATAGMRRTNQLLTGVTEEER
jgi:tetratricopeptide (TPR) repeat protein